MKYLIFGDVHGNLPALELMLKAERNNYDVLVSHGDVVNYGPWSNECVDVLETVKCICLKGNHEDYFLSGHYPGHHLLAKEFFNFCFPQFKKQSIISLYNKEYRLHDYCITHTLNNQYVYPDSDLDVLQVSNHYIFGHSHYQFLKKSNGHVICNTGSVGQNRKFINVINYVLFTLSSGYIELKSIKYNVNEFITKMKEVNYPQVCIDYYRKKEQA